MTRSHWDHQRLFPRTCYTGRQNVKLLLRYCVTSCFQSSSQAANKACFLMLGHVVKHMWELWCKQVKGVAELSLHFLFGDVAVRFVMDELSYISKSEKHILFGLVCQSCDSNLRQKFLKKKQEICLWNNSKWCEWTSWSQLNPKDQRKEESVVWLISLTSFYLGFF